MALYLPSQHIAFEVVDDPCSAPVDAEAFPGITVVRVTAGEITRPELLESIARSVRGLARRGARGPAGARPAGTGGAAEGRRG